MHPNPDMSCRRGATTEQQHCLDRPYFQPRAACTSELQYSNNQQSHSKSYMHVILAAYLMSMPCKWTACGS